MALRQHGDHDTLQKAVLPDHHAFDLVQNLFHQLGGVGFVCAHVRGPVSKKGVGGYQTVRSERRHAEGRRGVFNGHRKTNTNKGTHAGRVEDGGDDADHLAVHRDQRPA